MSYRVKKIQDEELWAIWLSSRELFLAPTFRSEAFAELCAAELNTDWSRWLTRMKDGKIVEDIELEDLKKHVQECLPARLSFDPATSCPDVKMEGDCERCPNLFGCWVGEGPRRRLEVECTAEDKKHKFARHLRDE